MQLLYYLLTKKMQRIIIRGVIITGPFTHSVGGGQYCFALWCLSSSVVVCNTPRRRICNVIHHGVARDGGPVV